jgi:hypothetical protein
MSEKELLDDIFEKGKWKDKYTVSWCDLCETAVITCPVCKNSSCNGSGCEECMKDADEWSKTKHLLEHYLPMNEVVIYAKCQQLKRFIVKSLKQSDREIDWSKLLEKGELSSYDEFIFKDLISNVGPHVLSKEACRQVEEILTNPLWPHEEEPGR